MKDQQNKIRFVELRAKSWSYDRIAKELKISKQSLINWSKDFSHQISNLRAIELEAVQKKHCLFKKQRIELLEQKMTAIKNELKKRNLTDVPTEKLLTSSSEVRRSCNERKSISSFKKKRLAYTYWMI